jgi:hypothetical protein
MTREEVVSAIQISPSDYLKLDSPEFMGQTRPNEDGEYKMYWKNENKIYYTINLI